MVINSYGKSPFEIRDSAGKEFKKIYDNQGRLLFKNWNEIQGSLPLQFKSYADYLKDYRIYGNSVRNGTPTPETPVEVQGVGEYDAELNCYKIPVTVSNGINSVTTPVYIGSEPLYKIGDYADYVDFKRGVVVRNIEKSVFTGAENVIKNDSNASTLYFLGKGVPNLASKTVYCTHLPSLIAYNQTPACFAYIRPTCLYLNFGVSIMDAQPSGNTAAGLKEYLATQYSSGTPVTVWYVIDEPKEEALENLLPIQVIKGSAVLTADTTVQPSEIYIKGKINSLATHMLIDSNV